MMARHIKWIWVTGIVFIVVLLSLTVQPFGDAVQSFFKGAFGGRGNFNLYTTISRASLIVGMAISVLVAFRAGLINIGGEGQLAWGALSAAVVGVYVKASPFVVMPLALLAALLVAGFWSVLAGWLNRVAKVPLVVGSLLLNYPAVLLASYLVSHPLRDVASGLPQTHKIDASLRLPRFTGTLLDYGVFFVLAVVVLVIVMDRRNVFGYRVRLHGFSTAFAKASGFPMTPLFYQAMFISGAIAGLVGFIAVFGINQRYIDGMTVLPLYSWIGIITVLLSGMLIWAVPISGFFFAALATGALGLERAGAMPREVALIVQALIILFAAGAVKGMLNAGEKTRQNKNA